MAKSAPVLFQLRSTAPCILRTYHCASFGWRGTGISGLGSILLLVRVLKQSQVSHLSYTMTRKGEPAPVTITRHSPFSTNPVNSQLLRGRTISKKAALPLAAAGFRDGAGADSRIVAEKLRVS